MLLLFLENILEISDFDSGDINPLLQYLVLMYLSSLADLEGLLAQVCY